MAETVHAKVNTTPMQPKFTTGAAHPRIVTNTSENVDGPMRHILPMSQKSKPLSPVIVKSYKNAPSRLDFSSISTTK